MSSNNFTVYLPGCNAGIHIYFNIVSIYSFFFHWDLTSVPIIPIYFPDVGLPHRLHWEHCDTLPEVIKLSFANDHAMTIQVSKEQNASSPLTRKYSILWGASVTER